MSLALCLLTGAHEVAAGDAGDWAPRRRSARSTAPERAGPLDDMVYRRGGAGQQSPFDALWPSGEESGGAGEEKRVLAQSDGAAAFSTSSGAKAESVDFLASVLFMTTDVVAAAVGTEIFESASCSIDSSCVPGWDANQRAVVQITHPVMGNFCSGTLIKGKDGAVYVLTANHCIQSIEASFVYPWSTYGVIFNYRLACNASFVDANDLRKFNQYLQGLRLAFADPKSDVALLRLLDDIPPEFNATTAGWDVCDTRVPFDWVDISDPAGDTEKYTKGVVNELIKGQIFYPDGSVGVNKGKCSGLDCAFFTGYPTRGDMQPGSSGSGLIHKDTRKVIGVLSAGGGDTCDLDPRSYHQSMHQFGRLSTAWTNGLWKVLGYASDERIATATEPYSAPLPGLIVDNDVPRLFAGGPPAVVALRLTAPPAGGGSAVTAVTLEPGSDLVSLNATRLVFGRSNWSVPQYVAVATGSHKLAAGSTGELFGINALWKAQDNQGNLVDAEREIRGVLRPATPGLSFSNPVNVSALPWSGAVDLEALAGPRVPFVEEQEGPYLQGYYLLYKTGPAASGIVAWLCPGLTRAADGPWAIMYDADWRPYRVMPPAGPFHNSSRPGCTGWISLLAPNTTYYIVASPSYNPAGPGAQGTLNTTKYTVELEGLSVSRTVKNMEAAGLNSINRVPARLSGNVSAFGGSTVPFLIRPPKTAAYDISTCNNGTQASTSMALYDADANLKLLSVDAKDPSGNGTAGHATGGGGGGGRCSQLLHQQLTGGNQYLLIIGEGIQATQLSRDANSTVVLTVTYAAQPHASPAPAFGSGSTSSSVARKAPARRQRRLLGGRRR